ncbi:MAG TPA: hypothetical protein VI306_14505 [Pyrinomonadaceae bacterium]
MLAKRTYYLLLCAIALTFSLSNTSWVQKEKDNDKKEYTGTPVLWTQPTDLATRNLLLGAGGEQMRPDIRQLTFIEQKEGGYSTKYRIKDASGNEWIAKIGREAQPDTVANRLLWAIGYETEIAYLYPHLTIEGKGRFDNVRLEARPNDVKRTGPWKWEENPFLGKPEFQALKIMMVMINNWDMKDDNNEILASKTGENDQLRYIISDLGGSFGKTGGIISRSRNKPSDYVKATFIEKVNGNDIDFKYSGKNKKLFENLTVDDARWLSNLLGQLSDEQIKDAFRAANYSPEDVELLTSAFKDRISELAGAVK